MIQPAHLWYVVMTLSVPVAAISALVAWQRRPEPGATPLAAMLAAVAWWSATYLGELLAGSLAGKLLWARLEWFGSVLIPAAWLLFALEYTGRDEYVNRRTVAALLVPWAVSNVLVWTNPMHSLVRVPLGLETANGLLLLDQQWGPWFLVIAGYTYVLVLAGGALLGGLVTSSRVRYRGQAVMLIAASLVPVVINAYSVFSLSVDLTPFGFALTGVAILFGISHYELLEATPVAALTGSEAVIESMEHGVLVVDARDRVVRANSATERLLDRPKTAIIGEPLDAAFPALEESDDGRSGVVRTEERGERWLEVNTTTLRDREGRSVGTTLVLRDVTRRREYHERVGVFYRVLRHNLRNEMTIVKGYIEQLDEEAAGAAAVEIGAAADRLLALGERARQVEQFVQRGDSSRETTLAKILERVAEQVGDRYPAATVAVETQPHRPVTCDALLQPVVENLVDNGLRHDPGPSPEVTIRADLEDDLLTLAVADDGPGISAEEASVVGDGPETPLDHSSGIGLWLVKWCLTRLDGSIAFHDVEGGGTVVRVEVPASLETDGSRSAYDDLRQ